MGNWITVGSAEAVTEDEPLSAKIGAQEVGIFRVEGELYAIEDVCPHAYALLSEGFVEGQTVECCLHGAIFDIPTGKCLKEPAERDVRTYQVRQQGADIQVFDE